MKVKIAAILLFVVLTIALTWPLLPQITTHIPGFSSTDEPYSILWDSWRIKFSLTHHLSMQHFNFTTHPFGVEVFSPPTFIWFAWHTLLSTFTSPVLTYNIQVVFNFLLCGLCAYLLVYFLTQSVLSALLSGIIFAFCPYQFVRSWQHLTATYNQWMPLTLLCLFLLKRPSLKTRCLFLLSIIVLFSFDYYLAFFTSIAVAVFCVYLLLYNWRLKLKQEERALLIQDVFYVRNVGVVLIVFFIFFFLPLNSSLIRTMMTSKPSAPSPFNIFHRPFEDLFEQSARPLSYILPAVFHPIFGKFTEQFIGTKLYGMSLTEHTLYLGWTPIILACVAFKRWRKNRKSLGESSWKSGREKGDFYIGFFLFLAVVAWLFSQPPWWQIGPLKIYMPSFFTFKIVPMFRAYCRFGIMVMLAVAVLAGFGLQFILQKFKTRKSRIAITGLLCAVALFEFWNYPPFKVINVAKVPAVYYWLKVQPGDFVIAEYPLDAGSPNEMYKFYQTAYEKRMINGAMPGTPAHQFAQKLVQLSSPKTADLLHAIGVKYVVVHQAGYEVSGLAEDREEFNRIAYNRSLKLIKRFPSEECPHTESMCVLEPESIDVYEVDAVPSGKKEP